MKPFSSTDLSEDLDRKIVLLKNTINNLDNDKVMANSLDVIAQNMYEKNKIFTVEIYDELIDKRDLLETKIKVYNRHRFASFEPEYFKKDGVSIALMFPFSGDPWLFECRASTYSFSGYKDIGVYKNYFIMEFQYELDEFNTEDLEREKNNELKKITDGISYANNDINKYNGKLKTIILSQLKQKKEKIEKFYKIGKTLNIDLKRNTNPAIITPIQLERKIIPLSSKVNHSTEYTIRDEDYNHILNVIKSSGSLFERTPDSFSKLDEESLRNIILSNLNGHYLNNATGETFRKKGKTDINIEWENKAAFIAECKIWKGSGSMLKAIDQLFGYLTWRDCKVSLILFCKNKNFFETIRSLKDRIIEHPNYLQITEKDKNEFESLFSSPNNDGQNIKLHIVMFDLSC